MIIRERKIDAIIKLLNIFPYEIIYNLLENYMSQSSIELLSGESLQEKARIIDERLYHIWGDLKNLNTCKKKDMQLLNDMFSPILKLNIENLLKSKEFSEDGETNMLWYMALENIKILKEIINDK